MAAMRRAVTVLCFSIAITASGQQHPGKYVFSAEDDAVPHAMTLPPAINNVVLADIRANILKDDDVAQRPSTWTSGTEVPSHMPGRRLFVLMSNDPVSGANTSYFWLTELDKSDGKARVVKRVGAHTLLLRYKQGERAISSTYLVFSCHTRTLAVRHAMGAEPLC